MKMLLVKQIDVVEIYADEAMALCRSRPRPESAWEFPGIPGKGKIGRNGSFLAHMRIPSRIPAHIALQTHMPDKQQNKLVFFRFLLTFRRQ